MLPPESRNEIQAQSLPSTPRLPSSPPQVMNTILSYPSLNKTPPPSFQVAKVLSITPHPQQVESRAYVPMHTPTPYTAHTNVRMTRIIAIAPLQVITRNQMHPLSQTLAQALYRGPQEIKEALTGVPTLLSPSVRCVHVVILARVRDALNTAVHPPSRLTKGRPMALHVRIPDSVHRVLNALLYLVIPISKLRRQPPSTPKPLLSWTSGYANSSRGCQLYRMVAVHSTGPQSTQTLPYKVVLPTLHSNCLIIVEEAAGVRRGFVLENVSATAKARGVGKETLRVYLSALSMACPGSGRRVDGIFQLVISLGCSANLGSPQTGPLTEK